MSRLSDKEYERLKKKIKRKIKKENEKRQSQEEQQQGIKMAPLPLPSPPPSRVGRKVKPSLQPIEGINMATPDMKTLMADTNDLNSKIEKINKVITRPLKERSEMPPPPPPPSRRKVKPSLQPPMPAPTINSAEQPSIPERRRRRDNGPSHNMTGYTIDGAIGCVDAFCTVMGGKNKRSKTKKMKKHYMWNTKGRRYIAKTYKQHMRGVKLGHTHKKPKKTKRRGTRKKM